MESTTQQLRCSACQWTELCDPPSMVKRLRGLGMLKRQTEPDPVYLGELLRTSASRLDCPNCGARKVQMELANDEEWDSMRRCESCGKPISPERLEALPSATRCASCQQAGETMGGDPGEPEYCPRCGSLMRVQQKGGRGLARYVLSCPECGR